MGMSKPYSILHSVVLELNEPHFPTYSHEYLLAPVDACRYAEQALVGAPTPHIHQVVGETSERGDQVTFHHADTFVSVYIHV